MAQVVPPHPPGGYPLPPSFGKPLLPPTLWWIMGEPYTPLWPTGITYPPPDSFLVERSPCDKIGKSLAKLRTLLRLEPSGDHNRIPATLTDACPSSSGPWVHSTMKSASARA
ncbi:hypothetical protein LIER_14093 [Lithospermum erythrorhizon]|uniref:Uncharacterized protein n=1 Tax=Lithospermum erythrorhizon TaxID=34254 RepID=A0AAV3PXS7_LITER